MNLTRQNVLDTGALGREQSFTRNYAATVGSDANGNITSVNEAWTGAPNTWKTDFAFDYENRLTKIELSATSGGKTVKFNTISHAYDGLNRLLKTTAGSNYGHVYDGNKLAGNANLTTSTNGTAWVNAANAAKPLASTQIQTVGATRYYNVSDERDPVRQVYTDAGTAGDTSQKSRYSEYKLIDGAAPSMVAYGGAIKQSELFRVRNITLTENSIVLPSANGSFEAAAISLNYEGTRVKSALIGRDLNPMGRGDGIYYFAGAMSTNAILPGLSYTLGQYGSGNSVNNQTQVPNSKSGPCGGSQYSYPPNKPIIKAAHLICCMTYSDCCVVAKSYTNKWGTQTPYAEYQERCDKPGSLKCDDCEWCGNSPSGTPQRPMKQTPGCKKSGGSINQCTVDPSTVQLEQQMQNAFDCSYNLSINCKEVDKFGANVVAGLRTFDCMSCCSFKPVSEYLLCIGFCRQIGSEYHQKLIQCC